MKFLGEDGIAKLIELIKAYVDGKVANVPTADECACEAYTADEIATLVGDSLKIEGAEEEQTEPQA